MKVRNGFVSNSSSSSFVIFYDADVCPHCKHIGNNLVELICEDRECYDETRLDHEKWEDYIEEAQGCFWWNDEEEAKFKNWVKETLEKHPNYKFISCDVGYNNKEVNYFLEKLKKQNKVEAYIWAE